MVSSLVDGFVDGFPWNLRRFCYRILQHSSPQEVLAPQLLQHSSPQEVLAPQLLQKVYERSWGPPASRLHECISHACTMMMMMMMTMTMMLMMMMKKKKEPMMTANPTVVHEDSDEGTVDDRDSIAGNDVRKEESGIFQLTTCECLGHVA